MLSKEQEQRVQEAKAAIPKIKAAIHDFCSKIGEIDRDVLEFIIRDENDIPSKFDTIEMHHNVVDNAELALNVMELYMIFDYKSKIIPQSMRENGCMRLAVKEITIPEALSEVRASLLDTTSVSEMSASTLDTTMGTNSSTFHGSSEFCE